MCSSIGTKERIVVASKLGKVLLVFGLRQGVVCGQPQKLLVALELLLDPLVPESYYFNPSVSLWSVMIESALDPVLVRT